MTMLRVFLIAFVAAPIALTIATSVRYQGSLAVILDSPLSQIHFCSVASRQWPSTLTPSSGVLLWLGYWLKLSVRSRVSSFGWSLSRADGDVRRYRRAAF